MEQFNGVALPAGWTTVADFGDGWRFTGTPGYQAAIAGDGSGIGGRFAWVDQSSTLDDAALITPIIDVTALPAPKLEFKMFSHFADPTTYNTLFVLASDGIGGFVQVAAISGDLGNAWTTQTFSLLPFRFTVGVNQFVQIRFRQLGAGTSDDFFNDILVDDVKVCSVM